MPEFDPAELTPRENARIIKTAVTPRPIAWISSVDPTGNENLAPFSSYNYVNNARPVLLFNSSTKSDGSRKDTARNVLETEEFAVNVVTTPHLEAMDATSVALEPEESEFAFADVERTPCTRIDPPRVADAPVTMECVYYDSMEVYGSLMILGEVVLMHVDDSVMEDGAIDSQHVDTVGRLGGPYYTVSEPVPFERQF